MLFPLISQGKEQKLPSSTYSLPNWPSQLHFLGDPSPRRKVQVGATVGLGTAVVFGFRVGLVSGATVSTISEFF